METPIAKIKERRPLYASKLRKSLNYLIKNNQLEQFLSNLNYYELEALNYDWNIWSRDNQLAPKGDNNWKNWLILGGRGAGKTRAGSEWVRSIVSNITNNNVNDRISESGVIIALIGETIADVRDIMLYGVSGIMNIHTPEAKPKYISNKRQVIWPNGAKAYLFSSLEPDSLRGFQFNFAWCDEFCKWRYPENCWNMLQFALRLGDNPKTLITTTPKPIKILKKIMNNNFTITDRCTSYDNKNFLPQSFIETTLSQYEGTRLGIQEIYAEILEDNENSLWQREIIDKYRVTNYPNFVKIIIAVDPPISSGKYADACGILNYETIDDASHSFGKLGYIVTGNSGDFNSSNPSDDLIELIYSLKSGFRNNGTWLMNRTTQAAIRSFKDADGNYIWMPPQQLGGKASIMNFPVVEVEDMPDIDADSLSIAFGDFKRGYLIVDRLGIRILRDPYSAKPYILFYTTRRVGGGLQNFDAIKLLKFGTA